MKTIREAIEAELKRQYEASGPYGQLHYLSFGEDGCVQLEGGVDLEQLSLAIRRHQLGAEYIALVGYDPFVDDPTQTVEQVEELIAGVRAEAAEAEQSRMRRAESLLRECLGDYGHPNFTDRHGMADRLRAFFAGS